VEDGIPTFDDFQGILDFSREDPSFFDICDIFMGYFPCKFSGIFKTARYKVDIWTNPDFSSVATRRHISYQMRRQWIIQYRFRTEESPAVKTVYYKGGPEDGVTAGDGFIVVSENQFTSFTFYSVLNIRWD
jgi:hypothetical protein